MGGRRDDGVPARSPLPPVPPRPATVPVTPSAGLSAQRVWLWVGLVLAVPATAAALLTENALYLRVALLAVCWAFVIAAFLAGSRRADQVAGAGREAELRHAYDLELAREVAARHEYEAELESRLRRETEHAVQGELAQLRTELAALTELRGELSGLDQLRAELAGLGELRSDLGRMRSELTEQLSGELLVERMVMRAQSVRGPAQPTDAGRTVEGVPPVWETSVWTSSPAGPQARGESGRALAATAAEHLGGSPSPIGTPAVETRAFAPADADAAPRHRPPSPLEWLVEEAVLEPWVEPNPRSPLAWLGEKALLDAAGCPPAEVPVVPIPSRPPLPEPALRVPGPESVLREPGPEPYPEPEPALRELTPRVPEPALRVSDLVAAVSGPVKPPRRRHRRAAEPDDDGIAPSSGRRRSHAAPDEQAVATSSWSDRAAAPAGSGSGTPATETSSWEPPAEPTMTASAPAAESSTWESSTWEPPSWESPPRSADPVTPVAAQRATTPAQVAPAQGHARLEQILAESGVSAPSGGRSRRRRYREEGEDAGDDVLARVLGRT